MLKKRLTRRLIGSGIFFLLAVLMNPAWAGDSLLVYSGAGLNKPMDEIGKCFEEESGVKIEYSYGGSAHILSQMEMSGIGDVFIPGDYYYFESAKEKGLTEDGFKVAYHIPVIAVPKGNAAGIRSLSDLTKPGVKVILGDEKAAAIGKLSKKILQENGLYEAVEKNITAKTATVNELVMYLTMGQADVSIVWEDNVFGNDTIEAIQIEKEKNRIMTVPIGVLKSARDKELARKFVDFVTSEKGKRIFRQYGFKTVD